MGHPAGPSPLAAGLACRCPRCGEGRLYDGLLRIAERCACCDLYLADRDAGDGPAVFVILILGFVVVLLALITESLYAPPIWLHLLLWIPLIVAGSTAMLRVFKAILIALHFRHRAGGDHGPA